MITLESGEVVSPQPKPKTLWIFLNCFTMTDRPPRRMCDLRRLLLGILSVPPVLSSTVFADDAENFFESRIRPVFVEHCIDCHGRDEQSGGLRLDSADYLTAGGAGGPVIQPGHPDTSRLIQAVRRSEDLAMPPDEELTPQQVRALEQWVSMGAPWPDSAALLQTQSVDVASHWGFQPVRAVHPPETQWDWVHNPIDAFILRRLNQKDLRPSPEADLRILIRRVSYSITGLPPSADDVKRFRRDNNDHEAYERLVERLLASPAYGEHWARHWLDVARYSDTKGYVYAREERRWLHAWSYRDWVIQSLNSDMPYDRFLLLQLAADQVPDRRPDDLAAMGFLTLGRRFLGVTREIMNDRIDVITRGTMGLTVACARCHDHKYDPVPTEDYYSLYGILHSCEERLVELPADCPPPHDWQKELNFRHDKFQTEYDEARKKTADRVRQRVGDYLAAQTRLHTLPAEGFDQVLLPDDLFPAFIRRWDDYLRRMKRTQDPVFVHWHTFAELSAEEFPHTAARVLDHLRRLPADQINPRIVQRFSKPPVSFSDVIDYYSAALTAVHEASDSARSQATAGDNCYRLPDDADEQLRRVLYGPDSPCEVPAEHLVHTEHLFDLATLENLWKYQGEFDRWIHSADHQPRYALTLADRRVPSAPRVFLRGNPLTPGDPVPRQFLSLLAGDNRSPFKKGSGRYELAQAITDPSNPLTARVIVNRVWARHFGQGLVTTPSDFGLRAECPSHPDLLDWLTLDFINHSWSLKHLHRRILLSAVFRQTSSDPEDFSLRRRAETQDPSNRLLWKMPLHRLTFEEFRDSILTVSGELDTRPGGRPAPLFANRPTLHRTVYGEIDRQFFPAALRVFDVANPDIHIPQRSETTVPQQALFYMNHPLVQDRARYLARATSSAPSRADRVQRLFEQILQRPAQQAEIRDSLSLVEQAAATTPALPPLTVYDWSYLRGSYNQKTQKIVDTQKLPHFTGSAWQGGPKWPDGKLGWVQLTAAGGHPGNDRKHAAIRRWTSRCDMTVSIESKLVHEAQPGDGVRAFIVSSRHRLLSSETVHRQSADLNSDSIRVMAGDTIDFAVDIGDILNSDQFLWDITIRKSVDGTRETVWNAANDFIAPAQPPLQPWEQLAHVLLCSNEFLFVD